MCKFECVSTFCLFEFDFGFCRLLLARHPSGFEIAVKLLVPDSEQQMKEIQQEINVLKLCKNDFIVGYYGSFGLDSRGRLWYVEICLCESSSFSILILYLTVFDWFNDKF